MPRSRLPKTGGGSLRTSPNGGLRKNSRRSRGSPHGWVRTCDRFAFPISFSRSTMSSTRRGVRERPDHRVCRTQASGRPWAEESLLPSDPRAPQGRTATRPRPVRPLRPTGPTGSARLRTPNRRGELPASHPRSYHLLADSGDRSCFERGGLGCGRSQLRVTVPYQPDRVGQRPPLRRVPDQPQSRAKRKA